jgi:hypothetical protein
VAGVIGDGIAAGVTVAGAGVIIVAGGVMASACPITDMDIIIRGIITAVITAMAVVGAIAIIGIGGIADGVTVAGATTVGGVIADGITAVIIAATGSASYESL